MLRTLHITCGWIECIPTSLFSYPLSSVRDLTVSLNMTIPSFHVVERQADWERLEELVLASFPNMTQFTLLIPEPQAVREGREQWHILEMLFRNQLRKFATIESLRVDVIADCGHF